MVSITLESLGQGGNWRGYEIQALLDENGHPGTQILPFALFWRSTRSRQDGWTQTV